MQFWRRKKLFHWHHKTNFSLFSGKWAFWSLGGILLFSLIYLFISLGSLRFFISHYFSLAGLNKNYLVLLQNQYELRPTGGFISAYGIVKFRFFLPVGFEIKDSYTISGHEYTDPPEVLGKLLADPWYQGHTFRDANWNPDFTQNTQDLLFFFHKIYPQTKIDGIISLNYSLIENIFAYFSPMELQNQQINQNTLFHFLEFETKNIDKHNQTNLENRKDVLKELSQTLIRKSFWHIPSLAKITQTALDSKDIQIWFQNTNLQKNIQTKHWDGSFQGNPETDNLGLVFANLGGKKADRYLEKNVEYLVTFNPKEPPQAEVIVTLKHYGDYSLTSDRYKGYLRLYFNTNSQVSNSNQFNLNFENNLQVIGTEINLNPGETQTFKFKYLLPPDVFNQNQYALQLLKQSGSNLNYKIILKVPGDMSFEAPQFTVKENRAFYQKTLQQNEKLNVKILPDFTPPLIYEQKFEALNHLTIFWNEPLDPLNANEKNNFEIIDTNQINPQTDIIRIQKITYDGHTTLHLYTEGITTQPLEQYQITLKNQQDRQGNFTSPSPKTITAVQRFDK